MGLDAGRFQQLAERYGAMTWPDRFAGQLIQGRKADGKTINGWPDSYALGSDGRIDALEATIDQRNWRGHLSKDIERAEALPEPGLGGFAFISSAMTPEPSKLTSAKQSLTRLGVPEDRQNLRLPPEPDLRSACGALRAPLVFSARDHGLRSALRRPAQGIDLWHREGDPVHPDPTGVRRPLSCLPRLRRDRPKAPGTPPIRLRPGPLGLREDRPRGLPRLGPLGRGVTGLLRRPGRPGGEWARFHISRERGDTHPGRRGRPLRRRQRPSR